MQGVFIMNGAAAFFLILGGLVHAIPSLYAFLANLTGGNPIIQIIVGSISVILGFMVMTRPASTHYTSNV
jgi:uncharacterized membrane protein HdeD (DUF308 family)